MAKKSRASKRKLPPEWTAKIVTGMRAARKRRRAAGLLLPGEVAALYGLPCGFVKRSMDAGELQVLRSGSRRYVRAESAERLYGVPRKLQRSA